MYIGKNIRLRAPERTDLPKFVEWVNDPEVRDGLTITYPMSMEDETHWFDHMLQQPLETHPMVIEAKDGKNWVGIGSCGFHDIDWRNANAEIGILIGEKKFWDKGYGTETILLLLKVGFEVLNMHRIWLRVHEDNIRAIRCYHKVGFVNEGQKRDAEFKNGKYIDIVLMSVLRPEWKDEYHPGV
jgi:RimJ/RimL family protein N-acetyltransferase